MAGKVLGWFRAGVPLAFVIAIACGIFLPIYTDEIGWRFQERAGFDGIDKLFAEQCGPNTLAAPPFFMWPARWYSAVFNGLFADPLYVRLSGILYALAFGGLLWALIRRVGSDAAGGARLGIVGFGLLCLGVTPLLLVLSRPEQPIILAAAGAVLIALSGERARGEAGTTGGAAWRAPLAILALGCVGLSYHVKGLFLAPLLLACLCFAGRGAATVRARLACGGALVALTGIAARYWVHRLGCPDDPVLNRAFDSNNLGSELAEDGANWREVGQVFGEMFGNLNLFEYVDLAAPRPYPLSQWLPWRQIGQAQYEVWYWTLCALWGLALLAGLVGLLLSAWACWKRRRIAAAPVLSLFLLATVFGWAATQSIRNFYEAGFVLPLLMLAIVLALASAGADKWTRRGLNVVATVIGGAALVSPVLVAGIWGASLLRSSARHGYIAEQRVSVSAFGYRALAGELRETARMCHMPEPAKARAVMVDDLTYFPFMRSHLPQHQLGVVGLWKGAIADPVAYLRGRGSDGIIVGCHVLPPELRARAKANGKFCCLAPPDW